MKLKNAAQKLAGALFATTSFFTLADNPVITHMFTADPTARVINGKMYMFPSTDIKCEEGFGSNNFCMPSYNVFSSDNLVDWTDHGLAIDQTDVPWGDHNGYGMWAPDAIEKDDKYYFYFPDVPEHKDVFRKIGAAVADHPAGPYKVMETSMTNVHGIDPNAFIDDDGQAYIYWGGGEKLYWAKLKDNMVEIEGKPKVVQGLPHGYKEGPFMFKRNGLYYFTFPHDTQGSEELAYAIGKTPTGPFEYKGDWMVFYHHHQISKHKNLRSVRADYLHFNPDNSIQKVTPTLRGIGIANAQNKIQIDRYSLLSDRWAQVAMTSNKKLPGEWAVNYIQDGGWIQYDRVDFGKGGIRQLQINAASNTQGGFVEIRLGGAKGELIGKVKVGSTGGWENWQVFTGDITKNIIGVKNLAFVFRSEESYTLDHKELRQKRNKQKDNFLFNIDWVRFK